MASRRPAFLGARARAGALWVAAVVAGGGMGGGCVQVSQENLRSGYSALSAKDYGRALALADGEIKKDPNAMGIAEAYYLRAAALENRPASSASESASNRAAARAAYEQALAHNPSRQLAAYTRASLGNVAFFQDDYAKAAEWSQAAYNDLDRPADKAIVLYRAGQSFQRMGRFAEADGVFAEVMARHPGTVQARAASLDRGARAFFVQLGAFRDAAGAGKAEDQYRRMGFRSVSTTRDARGLYLVRVGPYGTYAQARAQQLAAKGKFPDAIIQP